MESKHSLTKNKYIIYGIVLIITLLFVFMALRNSPSNPLTTSATPTPTVHIVNKTASIYFSPASISASSQQQSVDIVINTGKSKVTAAQIELQYDPKVISNMQITPATGAKSLFGDSGAIPLINKVDPVKGKIQYAVGVSPTAPAKSGTGTLVTLQFNTTGLQKPTTITFVPQTLVTSETEVESILKNTTPLTITVK